MTNYLYSCKESAIEAFLLPIRKYRGARHRSIAEAATFAVRTWRQRSMQRQALREMTDHQLRDIGISRRDALLEADKPFWLA
ncbi:MAG: DUF1127 domain-containing protein [Pseudomonadota bacterium]